MPTSVTRVAPRVVDAWSMTRGAKAPRTTKSAISSTRVGMAGEWLAMGELAQA
jgi:hypothetical protein